MGNYKILIADDDDIIRNLIKDLLEEQDYEVLIAKDGSEAIDVFFAHQEIDLVILDVMMPKLNGWSVLKEIRQHCDVPVLMLTALSDDKNEVYGLENGANDYISKPFSYEVLMARIKVLLRDVDHRRENGVSLGDITIETASHKVLVNGNEVYVNNKEFQLLLYLMQNNGRVLTRDQMLNYIWGYEYDGSDRTVDTHIKMLRAKLEEYGSYIKTVRGNGYLFEPDQVAVEKDERAYEKTI